MTALSTALFTAAQFTPNQHPIGESLLITALVCLVPLVVFFVCLGAIRLSALWSAIAGLATAFIVAVWGMHMPAGLAALSATQGIAFGLFPIMWIVVTAIWFYEVTVLSGRFDDLRRVFSNVGQGDIRIQAMLIAFCFGGLLEALAGFGAPVAITGVMLVALGLPPIRAAVAVLVANTAPVAFGAMAIPITTAGTVSGLDPNVIASTVGRMTPLIAWIVPTIVVFIIDGWRSVRQLWPITISTGIVFSVLQYWCSSHFAYELTDVVASLGGFAFAAIMLRFWKPKTPDDQTSQVEAEKLTGVRIWMALVPYIVVVLLFGVTKLWKIGVDLPAALANTDVKIKWPGLYGNLLTAKEQLDGTHNSASAIYNFQWLSSPGTTLFVTGLIVTIIYVIWNANGKYKLGFGQSLKGFIDTIVKSRVPIATVALVLAIAYVMNFSGQTVWIGLWLAGAGGFFAFLSPILGWLGTGVTGSDTSANALFGKMQATAAAGNVHLEHLFVAANTGGGVVGKMISPQNLTIAATAVDMKGQEGTLLRKSAGWSIGMLLVLCVIVYLQSTPILGWMLPTFH